MLDITKCTGLNCPLKESCYRYKAKSDNLYQSYFIEVPYNSNEDKCEYYYPITEKFNNNVV